MKITREVKCLEVFYDGECGGCGRAVTWLRGQEHLIEMVLLPYQGAEARARFPEILDFDPGVEMISRVDSSAMLGDGQRVFRGAESWVMCLWACRGYRWVARFLALPVVFPVARVVGRWVAGRRREISALVFGTGDDEFVVLGEDGRKEGCDDGECGVGL